MHELIVKGAWKDLPRQSFQVLQTASNLLAVSVKFAMLEALHVAHVVLATGECILRVPELVKAECIDDIAHPQLPVILHVRACLLRHERGVRV